MFKVRVIPCLDVKGGRVVKGSISSTCATPATQSSGGIVKENESLAGRSL
jgi:imidazole glycerol phosphate synthase subunit HisF